MRYGATVINEQTGIALAPATEDDTLYAYTFTYSTNKLARNYHILVNFKDNGTINVQFHTDDDYITGVIVDSVDEAAAFIQGLITPYR